MRDLCTTRASVIHRFTAPSNPTITIDRTYIYILSVLNANVMLVHR